MASVNTVEKTLNILQLISKYPEGLTLTEIYKMLDLPKVTVYDILKRLYAQEAVYYRNFRLKKYAIGPKMFAIGQAFITNENFFDYKIEDMIAYAKKYNLTVFASTRTKDQVVYVYKTEGEQVRLQTKDVGFQIPITECPDGKCFLSFEENIGLNELAKNVYNDYFSSGKDDKEYETMMQVIAKSRELGYILDDGITEKYIFAMAFPVFNFENKMMGVISACRFINNESDEKINNQIEELKTIASDVSKFLGYRVKK